MRNFSRGCLNGDGQKHSKYVRVSLGESRRRRCVACLMVARGRWDGGRRIGCGGSGHGCIRSSHQSASFAPKIELLHSPPIPAPSPILLCANKILVNVSPGQTDAVTSMRSPTMDCPIRWWRCVRWGGMMNDEYAGLAQTASHLLASIYVSPSSAKLVGLTSGTPREQIGCEDICAR